MPRWSSISSSLGEISQLSLPHCRFLTITAMMMATAATITTIRKNGTPTPSPTARAIVVESLLDDDPTSSAT